jgi:cytochrome c
MSRKLVWALGLVLAATSLPGGRPAAAAPNGASAFDTECGDCHSVKAGRNKKGPSLAGVVGRKPASIPDFTNYSDAMRALGQPWTADRIAQYIRNPKSVVPGGTMKYEGLADEATRASIVNYLATVK